MRRVHDDMMDLRTAAQVKRWHTMPTGRTQTLAEHSFGVAQLALYVLPESSAVLLSACLWHDLGEYMSGDVPAYAKWNAPKIRPILQGLEQQFVWKHDLYTELSGYEKDVLHWCDAMELVLWISEDMERGNSHPDAVYAWGAVMNRLEDDIFPTHKAEELYEYVKSERNPSRWVTLPVRDSALGLGSGE